MPSEPAANTNVAPAPAATAANSRKKQTLVAVLVIGLVVALLTQPDDPESTFTDVVETSTVSFSTAPASIALAPSSVVAAATSDDQAGLIEIRQLSRIELPTIVQLELLAPEANQPQRAIATQVPEVQAVYGTSQRCAALVGESIVRGGHPLPGGVTVLGVTEDGIRVGRE